MESLTPRQLGILKHAIGNGHRNYYAASEGHHSYDDCVAMQEAGLMGTHPRHPCFPDTMFYVTDAGRKAVRDYASPD